jgi:hypothetical protein
MLSKSQQLFELVYVIYFDDEPLICILFTYRELLEINVYPKSIRNYQLEYDIKTKRKAGIYK